jgi:hypothetical protein
VGKVSALGKGSPYVQASQILNLTSRSADKPGDRDPSKLSQIISIRREFLVAIHIDVALLSHAVLSFSFAFGPAARERICWRMAKGALLSLSSPGAQYVAS